MGECDKAMQNSIHDRTDARLAKLEKLENRESSYWIRVQRQMNKARSEQLHKMTKQQKKWSDAFDELLRRGFTPLEAHHKVFGDAWTPSDPEQVAHLEVNEIKEMRKKADDYNARLRKEEKAHRKHLEEMLAEYKKRWGLRLAPNFVKDLLDAVTPKERCFGDSFSRPSAPTVVSVDTAPYEFCWKVCKKEDGCLWSAMPNTSYPSARKRRYHELLWTTPAEGHGPLTGFAVSGAARRFSHHMDQVIFLAIGQRSAAVRVWEKSGATVELGGLPKNTRLYDRIMLLQEVE